MDVAPVRLQQEDGIADQLSRAVVGDVATAARLVQFDAAPREFVGRDEKVGAARADAKRDDGWMLQQQQLIGDAVVLAVGHEPLLQAHGIGERDDAEAANHQRPGGGRSRHGSRRLGRAQTATTARRRTALWRASPPT